jgi:hypothetical protein
VVKSDRFTAPAAGVESARVRVAGPVGEVLIHPLTDSTALIDADLRYVGEVEFRASGEAQKIVDLQPAKRFYSEWLDPANWFGSATETLRWDVGLSPHVPMELAITGGAGQSQLHLDRLQVTDLRVNIGVGQVELVLPATTYRAWISGGAGTLAVSVPTGANVEATLKTGVGTMQLDIQEGAAVNARIEGGVGPITLRLPPGGAVRLQLEAGLGGISLPSHLRRVRGEAPTSPAMAQVGVWESANYATADPSSRIRIQYRGGLGGLTVR